jgi:hypothetical protein
MDEHAKGSTIVAEGPSTPGTKPAESTTATAPATSAEPNPKDPRAKFAEEAYGTAALIFAGIADRFGVPFAMLGLLVGLVKFLGSEKTQDDFVRELLFGAVNKRPILTIVVAAIVLDAVVGFSSWVRHRRAESKEMKRLADEKGRLQEALIGELHRTGLRVTEVEPEPPRPESDPSRGSKVNRKPKAKG